MDIRKKAICTMTYKCWRLYEVVIKETGIELTLMRDYKIQLVDCRDEEFAHTKDFTRFLFRSAVILETRLVISPERWPLNARMRSKRWRVGAS